MSLIEKASFNNQGSTPFMYAIIVRMEKIENNTTSSSDIELSEVATGDNAVGIPATFSGCRSKRCETRTLALLINFLIFFLNGWSGYVVHSQVSALKTEQRN